MMKKVFGFIILTLLSIGLIGCKKEIKAEYITPNSNEIFLNIDTSIDVLYKIVPSDATNTAVEIKSSNEEIVQVTEGKITGIKIGEAKITLTLKKQVDIKSEITVYVVNKEWPIEKIKSFAGFIIPEFNDYTNVTVNEKTDSLELIIKGISNHELAMNNYKEELLNNGFKIDGTFDAHGGSFIHNTSNFLVNIHNSMVHSGDSIEIIISKEHHDHDHDHEITWKKIQEKVLKKYKEELPNFVGINKIEMVLEDEVIEFKITLSEYEKNLNAFIELLVSNKYIAQGKYSNHAGTFIKDDVKIFYHQDHHDLSVFEVIISSEHSEHNHDHEITWKKIQEKVLKQYKEELPNFAGVNKIEMVLEDEVIEFKITLSEYEKNLKDFIELLISNKYIAHGKYSNHAGTFIKDDVKIFYHQDHDNPSVFEVIISSEHHEGGHSH